MKPVSVGPAVLALPMVLIALLFANSCASSNVNVSAKEYFDLANLYESQKDLAKAADMYAKAIKIDPSYRNARYNLAHIHILQGKYALALPILETLRTEDPGNQAVAESLAYAEAKQGQFEKAWADYQAVMKITEGRESVLFNLVLIGKYLGKKAEAYDYASRLLVIKPAEPAYMRGKAVLALMVGKETEAEPLLAAYARAKEKDAIALISLADELSALSFHARAIAILEGIVAADPKNSRAYLGLAKLYYVGAQDSARAKTALGQALELGVSDNAPLQEFVQAIDEKKRAEFIQIIQKTKPDFKYGAEQPSPSPSPAPGNPIQAPSTQK